MTDERVLLLLQVYGSVGTDPYADSLRRKIVTELERGLFPKQVRYANTITVPEGSSA